MFLRKYIVTGNIDLEHNRVWNRGCRGRIYESFAQLL